MTGPHVPSETEKTGVGGWIEGEQAGGGRGQARAFGAADLAAILATCHRPRRRVRRGRPGWVVSFRSQPRNGAPALRWPRSTIRSARCSRQTTHSPSGMSSIV